MNAEITRINKILAERFGSTLDGSPYFRLVWSDSQLELRKGTFNEFYGEIFLRTYEGVKEVRKYNYIAQRWILEKWNPPYMVQTPEIINHNGYEPIYIFEDKDRNPLLVNFYVCNFIIYNILNPTMDRGQRKQYLEDKLNKEFKDEVAYFEDCIEDRDNAFRFKLREGEAILNPSLKEKENA